MSWKPGTPQMGEHRQSAAMWALQKRIEVLEAVLGINDKNPIVDNNKP